MARSWRVLLATIAVGLPPALAAEAACTVTSASRYSVVRVVDATTLELNDGSHLRIAGILPPDPPLGSSQTPATWPARDAAMARLAALTLGKTIALTERTPRKDRYGRLRSNPLLIGSAAGETIAALLVAEGHARVYQLEHDKVCGDDLLAAEAAARKQRLGLWQIEAYRVRPAGKPRELAALAGQMQIVEGRVLDASANKGRVYLNFGARWKVDFTVEIGKRLVTKFRKAAIDLTELGGKRVRVRGFISIANGPRITLALREHLEFIDPAPVLAAPEAVSEEAAAASEVIEILVPTDR